MALFPVHPEQVARDSVAADLLARAAAMRERADRNASLGFRKLAAAQRQHAQRLRDRARQVAQS